MITNRHGKHLMLNIISSVYVCDLQEKLEPLVGGVGGEQPYVLQRSQNTKF